MVIASRWPEFHPIDAQDLIDRFEVDVKGHQYFDYSINNWVNGGPTTPACNLQLVAKHDLHYRSDGVRSAPGMPNRGSVKRAADCDTSETAM